ncbi:MAG: 3-hydroxyacyl-CoA dehydrogenase [Proteobacteria bacterium]|nr:3-hydroxyacyl-CoA dehydrogenase [Pseudomonadota bacterium]
MTKIAIIGTGLIGRAWATIFCSHGFEVSLFDANPAAAKAAKGFIGKSLKELAGHGLVKDVKASLQRVHLAKDLAHALKGAALAQENGPETLEAKKALFAEMDRLAPKKTILASSTSFIVASAFSEGLPGQARCMVAHPVNPPHLVPIVELAPAPWTDPKAVARARKIYEKAGQVPVDLRKEVPGFILNRLQAVLLTEAFRIIGAGICSPQDLDKTIKDGLGLRWSFMGPFETIELNAPGGIPDYCARYGPSLERMSSEHLIPDPYSPATVQKIMAEWPGEQSPERIAKLSKWRDARLAALKAHKLKALKKPAN